MGSLNDIETIISTILDKEGKLMDFFEGGDYSNFNSLFDLLSDDHPIQRLKGKKFKFDFWNTTPNMDTKEIVDIVYHMEMMGILYNLPNSNNPTFTPFDEMNEESLEKMRELIISSINSEAFKSLNENVKYEKEIEDIDKKLKTEEGKYERRMLLKRKEGIRDQIENEIVGLLYTILRANDLIIGVDKTPMIQYFKDKGVETGLIDIINEPIRYSGMTTYIKEIYLDYGTCFIIFDNTGTEYKQLIQKVKLDKILAIYKTMLTVINRPVLKKLQEGLKEDYLETPDKSEIDWRSPLHIELSNTFNNLIKMIVDKYKIDTNSNEVVSILKEIEKKDRKSPLINLIGKVLRTIDEEAEEFELGDIISYPNEEQLMIAFKFHDHFIIDYPSRMKFTILYPIYEEIITTLNTRALRDLNEGMKEDYINNKKIMKFGDYFDGSVQSASYNIYKISEKLLDIFEDLLLKIVDKYNINITSNDARSGLFSVLEKEHPNSPILELKEHVFKTVKDNREFTLFEIYSDREPKIRYNFSYVNEPYQIHDSPALDFELLYPIYEKLLTVLNTKALQDLNI